ncbi:UNVERIFIED_CONTAM: hypothetical protein RKD50_004520 [Streptomyces canus]
MTAATGSVPAVPPALRAQATRQRGGYVYAIDPYFDPAGAVPPCGIVGGWSVDHSGQLVSFTHNPKYRPSPIALEFPAPLTALDAAVQRAVTGYGSEAELLAAFRDATLILFAQEGQDGLYTVADDDGGRYIPAFTHRDHTPGAWQQWRQATEATAGSGSGNARVRERRDDALALARGPLPADRPKGRYTLALPRGRGDSTAPAGGRRGTGPVRPPPGGRQPGTGARRPRHGLDPRTGRRATLERTPARRARHGRHGPARIDGSSARRPPSRAQWRRSRPPSPHRGAPRRAPARLA